MMRTPYVHSKDVHNTRAAEVVVPVLLEMLKIESVLYVGCGIGTWLNVLQEKYGINDIVGMDGSYVDRSKLEIEDKYFKEFDLGSPFNLNRKFDLCLCLEVAEHLPESTARFFVESLCKHSDNIAFSAAIPGQGGQNHINEQWPAYWEHLFKENGFVRIDTIRPKIWDNDKVDVWYRQNMFLFRKSHLISEGNTHVVPLAEIHPDFWLDKVDQITALKDQINAFANGGAGIKRSFSALMRSLVKKLPF